MITLPGGLNVCRDCMQRSFDMMMGSGMDWTKMSGFTPEMLKNMYLDPEKAKDVIGHTGDGEKEEEQTAENTADPADNADEDKTQTVEDADESDDNEDFEEDGEEMEGIPLGNIFGIPVGQIDLGALMGQGHKRSKKKKKKVKETSAKYEGIVRWIREQIEAEELQPGERIESEYQLCDRFGVSRQTVRHAIAVLEKEGMIEKRRGSGTYIKESGIIGVRRKKTMQIAVMTTFVQEYIFSGIIQEIENKMSRAGYGIQISITNNSVDKERFILKSILDKKRVDGIIAEPTKSGLPNPNLDLYRQIMEQGIPVIFINSYYPELKAPHVSLDDKIAGKMATKYLIQCGHREIAAIFKADDGQGHRRYAGYIEALMEADIRIEDKRIVWIDTEDVRNRNMREESSWILRRIQGCTACVCYNDEVASNLAATCLEQKIKVPDKMSIIGIDDSDLANYCEVPLASVKNPIRELAKKAAEEILDLMQEKEVPDSVELKPEIINRSSVKIIK